MREIKFRAWDTIANGWMSELLESGYSEDNYDNPYGKDEWYTKIGYMLVDFDMFKGRLIWSQYTGLKDKNGVEIYEYDILKIDVNDGEDTYKTKVGSALNAFQVDIINCDYDYTSLCWIYDSMECVKIEVIGNIYENPNLLKEK